MNLIWVHGALNRPQKGQNMELQTPYGMEFPTLKYVKLNSDLGVFVQHLNLVQLGPTLFLQVQPPGRFRLGSPCRACRNRRPRSGKASPDDFFIKHKTLNLFKEIDSSFYKSRFSTTGK